MLRRRCFACLLALTSLALAACTEEEPVEDFGENPFLETSQTTGKADTAYLNPDGIEVEVDLEGDVQTTSYRLSDAPAALGQFALTYLRKRGEFYLESLAEDASSDDRVEWLVDGNWITAAQARSLPASKLTHFRLRAIDAVLLHSAANGVEVGRVFEAPVPMDPFNVYTAAGNKCADEDGHMELSASVYWYLWNPDLGECTIPKQNLKVTVSKMFQQNKTTYPEYDQLVADGKVTAVVLFGQIGEGSLENDSGMRAFKQMGTWLKNAGFTEVTPAPVGKRYTKRIKAVDFEIDLYSPADFSGLSDYAHFSNFQKGLSEHEIFVYDGHSMLGASDFWSRPDYPEFYQIFLYGGCLGYEYYVKPILKGKGGWDKVDIMSSVVEVSANALDFAGPALAKIAWALENDYNASWEELLVAVRRRVGDSTFGVSGVTGNCFSPKGSLCVPEPENPSDQLRVDATPALDIPDNDPAGVRTTLEVGESFTATAVALELDIKHSWIGDLEISLEHNGKQVEVWKQSGGSTANLQQSFVLGDFAGTDVSGTWTLSIADLGAADLGSLQSWALVFTR